MGMKAMVDELIRDREHVYNYLSVNYDEVNGYDFYRYIFPNNQTSGVYTDSNIYNPNAIYLYPKSAVCNDKGFGRRIMLNDTWEEDYMTYVEAKEGAICGGLAYRGKANLLVNAQRMNALIIDLDSVGLNELLTLFKRIGREPEVLRSMPMPTFLVTSGTGIHIYYVLDEPIDLYPNIKTQLKALKHALTFKVWDYKNTTKLKDVQYQSINQGFRMVGSINEKYGTVVKAFKTGDRVSLETLNSYVKEKDRVDITKRFTPSKYKLEEAKELFPEWYQKVVIEGNTEQKEWDINRGLYDWWVNKLDEVSGGHRYHYMLAIGMYAYKCKIPYDEYLDDLRDAFDRLVEVEHTNPLTEKDLKAAKKGYSKKYVRYTGRNIARLAGVTIEPNKRNGRTQEQHIQIMNAIREVTHPNGSWRNKNGRPKKEKLVKDYIEKHPDENPTQIAKALGISRPTVYKYMK